MIRLNATRTTEWIPPQSFTSGAFGAFSVIAISELGDKTFFIAVVLALTYSPLCVFLGAISALTLMTLLSAGLGLVSTVIPYFWMQCLSATLFLLFGFKMLWESYTMKSCAGKEEFEDAQKILDSKIATKEKVSAMESRPIRGTVHWVFLQAFAMTFLAEWGDRSQITTVLLAAKDTFIYRITPTNYREEKTSDQNVAGVIVGATLGHAACTVLAVVGGRIVADKISLKIVTIFGGLLFLVFAAFSIVNAVNECMVSSPS